MVKKCMGGFKTWLTEPTKQAPQGIVALLKCLLGSASLLRIDVDEANALAEASQMMTTLPKVLAPADDSEWQLEDAGSLMELLTELNPSLGLIQLLGGGEEVFQKALSLASDASEVKTKVERFLTEKVQPILEPVQERVIAALRKPEVLWPHTDDAEAQVAWATMGQPLIDEGMSAQLRDTVGQLGQKKLHNHLGFINLFQSTRQATAAFAACAATAKVAAFTVTPEEDDASWISGDVVRLLCDCRDALAGFKVYYQNLQRTQDLQATQRRHNLT